MYHTTSFSGNTQSISSLVAVLGLKLAVSQYLGVCTVSDVEGTDFLLTRNDGENLWHWEHEFVVVSMGDAVTYVRNGAVMLGVVVGVDLAEGELELVLDNGERGWADAHAVKAVVVRSVLAA